MKSEAREGLGRRVTELRERKSWTQKKLAEEANLSVAFLSDIENGKRNVGSEVLLRIASVLRASLDYLMLGSDPFGNTQQEPISIPPALDEAAGRESWSYSDTMALLETQQLIVARRGGSVGKQKPGEEMTPVDWINYRNRIFGENDEE